MTGWKKNCRVWGRISVEKKNNLGIRGTMKVLKTRDKDFQTSLANIRNRGRSLAENVEPLVKDILNEVKNQGDSALIRFTEKFDGHNKIEVSSEAIKGARKQVKKDVISSLQRAFRRIEAFHCKQIRNSWIQTGPYGEILGQMVRPLQKVGVYVPGGKAVYPSSVLMNAVPAKIAGVEEIIMVTPGSSGTINPVILAAAEMCGITRVFQIGGAQAVAALAYGTDTVPKVDKIVGPGNIYVALAKKLVYGEVDIDMIAGPSEILIISDGSGSPAWVAADMLSQAEHDEMASSIVITTDEKFARAVEQEVYAQLDGLPRKNIAGKSIENHAVIIIAETLPEVIELSNAVAPEHLELYVRSPWDILPDIKNAGAVFMGYYSPEPVGDYIAGPNHVLPTGGTARFFSPLSVDDFIKKMSLVSFTQKGLSAVGKDVMRLAGSENLEAHAKAVEKRLKDKN
jgi:histidinol dehydrogenase